MGKRRKSILLALAVTGASAGAAWVIKQRSDAKRAHVGLYFEDGSMVSLPESAPQAEQLLRLGTQAVSLSKP